MDAQKQADLLGYEQVRQMESQQHQNETLSAVFGGK